MDFLIEQSFYSVPKLHDLWKARKKTLIHPRLKSSLSVTNKDTFDGFKSFLANWITHQVPSK